MAGAACATLGLDLTRLKPEATQLDLMIDPPNVLDTTVGRLSFVSTVTVFGTPVDITLSELAIEAFFPADAASASLLRKLGS